MNDRFDQLLQALGQSLNLTLHSDKNHACAIQIRQGLIVQFQSDAAQEFLLIACKVVEVAPGKFRENVLKEALKANGLSDPRVGIFAYIRQINQLVLFQRYPFDILTEERLAGLLGPFIKTAESWKEAILAGRPAPLPEPIKLPNPMRL